MRVKPRFFEQLHEKVSPFAFPILLKDSCPLSKLELQDKLKHYNIDSRLLAAGNLTKQPFMKKYGHLIEIRGSLDNANLIHKNAFFIGLNQGTNQNKINYIIDTFNKIINEF